MSLGLDPQRAFSNPFPDFEEAGRGSSEDQSRSQTYTRKVDGSLSRILTSKQERFLVAGLDLKNRVLAATWRNGVRTSIRDPFAYVGTLGTAVLLLRAYSHTQDQADLAAALDVIGACAKTAHKMRPYPSFLCGQPGIYSLGAVAALRSSNPSLYLHYLNLLLRCASDPSLSSPPSRKGAMAGLPYELLYGRVGFLWCALYVNSNLARAGSGGASGGGEGVGGGREGGKGDVRREEPVPASYLIPIIRSILDAGRLLASKYVERPNLDNPDNPPGSRPHQPGASSSRSPPPPAPPPLMFEWHGTCYWGAAHGLAGICHVLLLLREWLSEEDAADVAATLEYMVAHRFPSGNYPSSEGSKSDRLVHWCHGAPGMAMALAAAGQAFPNKSSTFFRAAQEASDVVWRCGLLKRIGICHGVSGNAYSFLSMYRATLDVKYLYRAETFGSFLIDQWEELAAMGDMHGGDHPHSLFEGIAGMACLLLDLPYPVQSRFPGFDI